MKNISTFWIVVGVLILLSCLIIVSVVVPFSELADYIILRLGFLVFVFILLANSVISLVKFIVDKLEGRKIEEPLEKQLIKIAWRSCAATAIVFLVSFLLTIFSFLAKVLSLFLKSLYVYIEKLFERLFGSSPTLMKIRSGDA
jgi:succinate dehydrogenase/fumarate reductase cytochrome b subunit